MISLVAAWLAVSLAAVALPGRWPVPLAQDRPARMRLAMGVALVLTGTDHLLNPWRYLPIMPPFVPAPEFLVLFTGVCEIAGGIGLLLPATRRLAGVSLAIFFAAVLPANVHAAINTIQVPGLEAPGWALWVRLLLQPVLMWWALHASGWPVASRYANVTGLPDAPTRPKE